LTSLLISLTRSIPSRSCRIGSNSSPIPGRPPFSARARHGSFNCCRQSGKSTTTAAVALHTAVYNPGLILLVSPSLRQSKELFAKVTGFLKDLEPAEVLAGSTSAALARSPAPGQEARAGAYSGDCDRPFRSKVITDSADRDHAVTRPTGSA